MGVMIIGLVLFIGIHLVPIFPALRERLVLRLGDRGYRGLFSAIAALGLILIVVGYHLRPEPVQLFAPSAAARAASPLIVTIAFILFAVANMRSHVRRFARHPMLIGLMLWSGVHLLANGDLTGTVLFGSFFVYSVVALASAIRRHAVKPFVPAWKYDLMAAVGGLLLAYLTMRVHPFVFGTGPVV
jgi:uncharacterized membrane protein